MTQLVDAISLPLALALLRPKVQSGTSAGAGSATITAVNTSRAFILSKSKGSAGSVGATGTFSTNFNFGGSSGTPVTSDGTNFSGTLSPGSTNLTTKQYSAVLTNATTVTYDGPVEWQVISW